MKKLYCINLGCPKNIVDTEKVIAKYFKNFVLTYNIDDSDAVFINTCSFISDAKKESLETIFEIKELNKELYVGGCLVDQHLKDIKKEIKDVSFIKDELYNLKDRVIYFRSSYSYLKISEGCNRKCSFCTIPSFKGLYRSRTIEDILQEARFLKSFSSEIIIVSQDTSYYGIDIYGKPMLSELLYKISDLGFDWIRVMYLYPQMIDNELINAIKTLPNVVKYIDLPLQHLSDNILKAMNRWGSFEDYYALVNRIRDSIPDISIRSAFIVGYPGETEKDFDFMLKGLEKISLDRVGFFIYSDEKDTVSYNQFPKVSKKVKERRLIELQELQETISFNRLKRFLNRSLKVLIEEKTDDYYIGRTEFDAPEIDGVVYVSVNNDIDLGKFYNVFIENNDIHDLYGICKC